MVYQNLNPEEIGRLHEGNLTKLRFNYGKYGLSDGQFIEFYDSAIENARENMDPEEENEVDRATGEFRLILDRYLMEQIRANKSKE